MPNPYPTPGEVSRWAEDIGSVPPWTTTLSVVSRLLSQNVFSSSVTFLAMSKGRGRERVLR